MNVPEPLLNVYRDLRDRRMLSIAIALVAAIIAVPFLMGGGSGGDDASSSSSPVAAAPFVGDEQLDPVVLAEAPGLRDFRQRLADYRSHNPFRVKLSEEERRALKAAQANGGGNGGGGSGGGGGGAGAGVDTGNGSGATPVDVPTLDVPADIGSTDTTGTTDTGTDTGSSDTGSGSSGDPSGGDTSGGSELVSYRVDVRVGPVGHTKVLRGVQQLEFLPDRRNPFVQFIDSDVRGTKVAFIVNPEAAALRGNGQCVRSKKDCQYLLMESGDEMYFDFNERQYRIEVMDIVEHREPFELDGDGGGDEPDAGRLSNWILGD